MSVIFSAEPNHKLEIVKFSFLLRGFLKSVERKKLAIKNNSTNYLEPVLDRAKSCSFRMAGLLQHPRVGIAMRAGST